MTAFDKAWAVTKNEGFGEKFNRKLDSHKEGARGVPEKFSDLKPTTGEDHNRKVMADILETDNDGIEGEYEGLKDMFDHEPQTGPSEDGVVAKPLQIAHHKLSAQKDSLRDSKELVPHQGDL